MEGQRKLVHNEKKKRGVLLLLWYYCTCMHNQRTLASLRCNQIPTFAICAWMPLATSAFTAPSAATGDSKSTKP